MSLKKNNKYKIVLQELELKNAEAVGKSVEFEFYNHDDILSIIERTKDSSRFENKSDNLELIVGLKLFSEVMLRNRNNPFFEELAPAFKKFMMKLKEKNS